MKVYLLWKKHHEDEITQSEFHDILIDVYTDKVKAESARQEKEKELHNKYNKANEASKTVNDILGVEEFPITEYFVVEEKNTK
jgi:hypothetical protein